MRISALISVAASAMLGLAGCSSTQLGQGGSVVQGSAGEAGNAQGANASLERCNQPLGTVTLDESNVPSQYYARWYGNNTNINSTIPMFRLLAAQSGCFTLVERGAAFEVLERERQLSKSGQLQAGSNIGDGQLAAADFVLRPEIIVSDTNSGGVGGAIGGVMRSGRSVASSVRSPAMCRPQMRKRLSTLSMSEPVFKKVSPKAVRAPRISVVVSAC